MSSQRFAVAVGRGRAGGHCVRGGAWRRRGDGRRSEQAFATERVTHLGEHLKSPKLSFLQIFRSMPRHFELFSSNWAHVYSYRSELMTRTFLTTSPFSTMVSLASNVPHKLSVPSAFVKTS